jgi:threonine 3-dehydrogenase
MRVLFRPLSSFSTLSPSLLSSLPTPAPRRILMTGGCGQLGTELLPYLNHLYKPENILVTDTKKPSAENDPSKTNNFEVLSVLDKAQLEKIVRNFKPNYIIHFAAILSANGERNPELCLDVNVNGFKNVLDVACGNKIPMFSPSTIAAFGASTPRMNTPNTTIMRPSTVYGCTKVFNELLGTYYKKKYGMDFRSIRYPQVN